MISYIALPNNGQESLYFCLKYLYIIFPNTLIVYNLVLSLKRYDWLAMYRIVYCINDSHMDLFFLAVTVKSLLSKGMYGLSKLVENVFCQEAMIHVLSWLQAINIETMIKIWFHFKGHRQIRIAHANQKSLFYLLSKSQS